MVQYFAWQNYVTINIHFVPDSEITLFPAVKQREWLMISGFRLTFYIDSAE